MGKLIEALTQDWRRTNSVRRQVVACRRKSAKAELLNRPNHACRIKSHIIDVVPKNREATRLAQKNGYIAMTSYLRCAVLNDNLRVAERLADWSAISHRVNVHFFSDDMVSEEAIIRELQEFDIVVLLRERTPFSENIINQLPRLKLIVTAGHRNGSLAVMAAQKRGIPILGTPILETPAAELTWALLLALARQIPAHVDAVRACGKWQVGLGRDLAGSTLGIIGLGRLGLRVARIGQAFGMDVVAWSGNLTQEQCDAQGIRFGESLHTLLSQSDFVSIHLVLSERTVGLIGADELASMRSDAYLINTSRAAIVDEHALVEALGKRQIAGAGLDVFLEEPLPPDHPFRTLPNVLATPHIGYVTHNLYKLIYQAVVEDIQHWLEGKKLRQITGEHPAALLSKG